MLQRIQSRLKGKPRQGQHTDQTLSLVSKPLLQACYLIVPGVTRRSRRRRAGGRAEPVPVLLGPFTSEIETRFMQTSAQALGLLVERADVAHEQCGDRQRSSENPFWPGFFGSLAMS